MKVFVSWSGDLSRNVAEVLRTHLPRIIQGLDVFMSKHDMESGGRWSIQLAEELEEARFGILCLTPDNLDSPWILFEAGALTKHVEGRACGLLFGNLGPEDIVGPLSQFQNRSFTPEEFGALLADLNAGLPRPLSEQDLALTLRKWWADIESACTRTLEETRPTQKTAKQQRYPS